MDEKFKDCTPKTCPIIFGCFLERESLGGTDKVQLERLKHWQKLGLEALKKEFPDG